MILTPFPGTVDFAKWEKTVDVTTAQVNGIPLTRRWLIPQESRPKYFGLHPTMSADEVRQRTQAVWDKFYSFESIWKPVEFPEVAEGARGFVLISKIYRQMYADTGITTDSARMARSTKIASWLAKPCRLLFAGRPMPDLEVPPSPASIPNPKWPPATRVSSSHFVKKASHRREAFVFLHLRLTIYAATAAWYSSYAPLKSVML